ncbi:RIP metalloprotease RseP [Vagococcus humatus]|uniref:Zinc metalloprotease n=1 Tax=Vagococcus humatus TaxID=1889241 RepID=A0A429Z8Q1_9ENTE|nr:RIP metalloprotease RseP [Vagococcus humatus]RST90053.1 RIP metalloprotease RseP [Vagococcus humatus]
MKTIITFIFVFGLIVVVHEFGHFLFAKLSGILVREFSIGMGPKLFSHRSQSGTTYTVRMLPVGGYVRMAGAGEEELELTPGQPVSIELNQEEVVTRINTSSKVQLPNSLPMEVTSFDLEDELFIKGYLNGDEKEEKLYQVDHDAAIIETDGIEVQIAPRDVQFQSAKLINRMLTNVAGPLFNFILTFILFGVVLFAQGGEIQPDPSSHIGGVAENSPAAKAGIKPGDVITSVNHQPVEQFTDIKPIIDKQVGKETPIEVKRDGKVVELTLVPKTETLEDGTKAVRIGIQGGTRFVSLNFLEKIKRAANKTWESATMIFVALKGLVTGFSLNKLGGPVMIFQVSSQVSNESFMTILNFIAVLSVNLGIVNLLPIPALDGGKLLLNLVEGIRRKPLSPEVEGKVTLVGVAFLFLLMILVTWNDIMRFFFR